MAVFCQAVPPSALGLDVQLQVWLAARLPSLAPAHSTGAPSSFLSDLFVFSHCAFLTSWVRGFHFVSSLPHPTSQIHSSPPLAIFLRSGFSNFVPGARYLLFPNLKAEFSRLGVRAQSYCAGVR